jgi:hypothetical protein
VRAAAGRLRCRHSGTLQPSHRPPAPRERPSMCIPKWRRLHAFSHGVPLAVFRARSSTRRAAAAPSAGAPGVPGAAPQRGAVGKLRCPVQWSQRVEQRAWSSSSLTSRRSAGWRWPRPAGGRHSSYRPGVDGISVPSTPWVPSGEITSSACAHNSALRRFSFSRPGPIRRLDSLPWTYPVLLAVLCFRDSSSLP